MNFGLNDQVMLDNMVDGNLNGSEAIVTEIYQANGVDEKSYAVFIDGYGPFAWVKAEQMELINRNQEELLAEWEAALKDSEE
jgi:hypothetical protein